MQTTPSLPGQDPLHGQGQLRVPPPAAEPLTASRPAAACERIIGEYILAQGGLVLDGGTAAGGRRSGRHSAGPPIRSSYESYVASSASFAAPFSRGLTDIVL
jgi:hypothetical protein